MSGNVEQPRPLLTWHLPLGLSVLAIAHFSSSALLWLVVCYHGWKSFTVAEIGQLLILAWPCATLFALSVVGAWISWKGHRGALEFVMALYLVSAAAFWYDVSHRRHFMSVGIASQKYWDDGNRQNHYLTWWWYNDRCLWKFWM